MVFLQLRSSRSLLAQLFIKTNDLLIITSWSYFILLLWENVILLKTILSSASSPTPAIVSDIWPHVGGFTYRSLLQLCTVLSLKISIVSFHFNRFVIPCCFSNTGLKCDYTQTVPPRTPLQVISVGHSAIHQQSNPVCVNWRSIDGLWAVCGPSWPVPRSVGFFWLPGGLPGCLSFWHTELPAE